MPSQILTLISSLPMSESDAELIPRIRDGCEAAFELMFGEYYDPLARYAISLLGSTDEGRDVVCEVFATVWKDRGSWDPKGGIRAYLFTAVRNKCFNVTRDQRRRTRLWNEQHPDDLPLPDPLQNNVDERIDQEQSWEAVQSAIDSMHGLRREAMVLRWSEQMSYREIASVMGISVNAVQLHISLGLKSLRRQFAKKSESTASSKTTHFSESADSSESTRSSDTVQHARYKKS